VTTDPWSVTYVREAPRSSITPRILDRSRI
jgi:hypothetical protein